MNAFEAALVCQPDLTLSSVFLQSSLNEFLEGLVRPSKTALFWGLCVFAGWVGFCTWFVTPQLLARAPGRFAAHNKDEYPFITARAWNFAHDPDDRLQVVILGDSATREAISSEEKLSAEISAGCGQPVRVTLLAAGGMTHFESAAISDLIHGHFRGILAVEISPYNLATPPIVLKDVVPGRLGFRSDRLQDEYRLAGMTAPFLTHNYFLDNYRFWIARPNAFLGMFTTPVIMRQHLQKGAVPWDDKKWKENHKHVYGWESSYRANRQHNLEVYRRMLQQAQDSGKVQFALLEIVFNPRNASAWSMSRGDRIVRQEYEQDVQGFAQTNSVRWLNPGADAQLTNDDFLDYTHVRTERGRTAYTHMLATQLAALLVAHTKPPEGT